MIYTCKTLLLPGFVHILFCLQRLSSIFESTVLANIQMHTIYVYSILVMGLCLRSNNLVVKNIELQ